MRKVKYITSIFTVAIFLLMTSNKAFSQNMAAGILEGKFIQLRFIGESFLDDSQEIGAGNLLVRYHDQVDMAPHVDQFRTADTLFLVDDITFSRAPCISEPIECQQVIPNKHFFKKLNKATSGAKSISGLEFCLVELTVDIKRIEVVSMLIPNLDFELKGDPLFVFNNRPTYILKCKGRPDW